MVKSCECAASAGQRCSRARYKWSAWTECSKECGTGIRSRTRQVVEQSGGGSSGNNCEDEDTAEPSYVQEELCNTHACDLDCQLSEWSAWSGCSKACRGGHQSRRKEHVLVSAVGNGRCWDAMAPQRLEMRKCNTQAECGKSGNADGGGNKTTAAAGFLAVAPAAGPAARRERLFSTKLPVCKLAASQPGTDFVFLIDRSGSMSTADVSNVEAFLLALSKRLLPTSSTTASTSVAKNTVSLLTFADQATTFAKSLASSADVEKAVLKKLSVKQAAEGDSTNTAQALAAAMELVAATGQETQSQRPATFVLITDGMPRSKFLFSQQVQRMKSGLTTGGRSMERLFLLTLGTGFNEKVLKKYASWPEAENYYNVLQSKLLVHEPEKVTDVVANLCAELE
eukprot:g10755.t1